MLTSGKLSVIESFPGVFAYFIRFYPKRSGIKLYIIEKTVYLCYTNRIESGGFIA